MFIFFFTQKTAYEMRISDWSSDVCSSDLPLRMWCTVSCATLLRQHLPTRPGSHQQLVSGSPASQASTLRHLSTTSLAKVGRWRKLMIELIVPGLLTWSLGIAEVSLVPGRACAKDRTSVV